MEEIIINPERLDRSTLTFEEFENILKQCVWDWDLLDEGSQERADGMQSYILVEEYMTALRIKYIQDCDDPKSLKKISLIYNDIAPDRYKLSIR